MSNEHARPRFWQHAAPHRLGEQDEPTPLNPCPAPWQPVAVVSWQVVFNSEQHDPTWAAHGSGEHAVPLPK